MRRQARTIRISLCLTAALMAGGCRAEAPEANGIPRQAFVDAYVDLRIAAIEGGGSTIAPEQRDEILARHGIDQDGFLGFADVHGSDLEYMNEVWADVERLMQERMPSEATTGRVTSPRPGA